MVKDSEEKLVAIRLACAQEIFKFKVNKDNYDENIYRELDNILQGRAEFAAKIENIVEGHDDVIVESQPDEKINYGFGFNDKNSIAIVWCIDDVRYQLKDSFNVPMNSLTDEECMEVLRLVEKYHDANEGTCYQSIDFFIGDAFGDKIDELQKKKGEVK
jgi:hypothetical protein